MDRSCFKALHLKTHHLMAISSSTRADSLPELLLLCLDSQFPSAASSSPPLPGWERAKMKLLTIFGKNTYMMQLPRTRT